MKEYENSSSGSKQQPKLKVLIAHTFDYHKPTEGGANRYFWLLVVGLLKRSVEVAVFGISSKRKNKGTFFAVERTGVWWKYLLKLFFALRQVAPPRDTIIHTGRLDFMLPFFVFCPKNPKVLTSDTPMFYVKTWPFPLCDIAIFLYNLYERWAVKRLDAIATDERTKKYFLRKYPWLEPKIHIVGAGVDLDKFRLLDKSEARKFCGFSDNDKIVMFAGRLEDVKNIPYLIEAFALLKPQIPKAKLVIVGSGSEEAKLRKLVESGGLKAVIFWGQQPPDKMPVLLNCADLLALTSRTEGSPLIVREALACGIPVVSRDIGDVTSTIINPKLGRIVRGGQEQFAAALVRTLNMPKGGVREACRKRSHYYDQNKSVERVIEIYRRITERRGT